MSPQQIEAWTKFLSALQMFLIVAGLVLVILIFSVAFALGLYDPLVDNNKIFEIANHLIELIVVSLTGVVAYKLGGAKKEK